MRPLIAGNWKTNLLGSQAEHLAQQLVARCDSDSVCLIPPSLYAERVARVLSGSQIALGGQDVSESSMGATTGDLCAEQWVDVGCAYVLVGHSERRQRQAESSSWVASKALAASEAGLIPIVCVGESLAQRQTGQQTDVVTAQLSPVVEALGQDRDWVVAYEPVWAIGTGVTASPEQAQDMHASIRAFLETHAVTGKRILYGGSVNEQNAKALQACPDVNGALVGGAALKVESFAAIAAAFLEQN